MQQHEPRSYRIYCAAVATTSLASITALAAIDGFRADGALAVVLVAAAITAAIGTVAESGHTALSLVHLPVLAAAYVCAAPVAPLLGAVLAANDNRAFGRWVALCNAGGLALSGGAAVAVFHGLSGFGQTPAPGEARWFVHAAAAAVTFFAVNHALVAFMVALRHTASARAVWRGNLAAVAGADVVGSTIVVASLGLGAAVDGTTQRVVVGLVAVMTVGLLLALLEAMRIRDAEVRARGEAEAALLRAEAAEAAARQAERRAVNAERAAVVRADVAIHRLHEVATGTVSALVALVDLKDHYTARHSALVGRLCRHLAAQLGWSAGQQAIAHVAGLVHDIGKVGIPDALIRKPAPPDEEEWDVIRQHPDWGADALANVAFAPALVSGVRAHHERWDGSGYPMGLRGSDIPVLARMIAVCDSYDAMVARRPFRAARGHDAALREITDEAGHLYDPVMVAALVAVMERVGAPELMVTTTAFAEEWRRACVGLDMAQLYVPETHPAAGRSAVAS